MRSGFKARVVGKQPGVDVLIVANLHKQMCAAVFAKTALRPFGRLIMRNVLAACNFRRLGGQSKRRAAAPYAASSAMAGVEFAVFGGFQ